MLTLVAAILLAVAAAGLGASWALNQAAVPSVDALPQILEGESQAP